MNNCLLCRCDGFSHQIEINWMLANAWRKKFLEWISERLFIEESSHDYENNASKTWSVFTSIRAILSCIVNGVSLGYLVFFVNPRIKSIRLVFCLFFIHFLFIFYVLNWMHEYCALVKTLYTFVLSCITWIFSIYRRLIPTLYFLFLNQ